MPRPDRRRSGPDTTPDRSNAESPSRVTDTAMVTDAGDTGTGPAVPHQRVPAEPALLGEVIGGLLEYSDLLDGQIAERLKAYREGYEHGRDTGYDQGYDDGIAERKRVQQDLVDALRVHGRRWELRGEPRARETFGKPHPDDFKGRKGAA